MNFIVGLLIQAEFKKSVSWESLKRENVTIVDQGAFETPELRNFMILSALKIQQLMNDLKEAQELTNSLKSKHQQWQESELQNEIKMNHMKEMYE